MTTPSKKPAAKSRSKKSDVFEKSVETIKKIDQTIKSINAKKAAKKKKSPFRASEQSKMSLKKLESMLRNQTTKVSPADFSTISKFQKSFEDFGEINGVLLLAAKDVAKLTGATDYHNFYDTQSRVEVVKAGRIGSIFGMQVWTDAFEPLSKRFVKNSVFVFIGAQ